MTTSHSPSLPQGGCGLRPLAYSALGGPWSPVAMPHCQDADGRVCIGDLKQGGAIECRKAGRVEALSTKT